MIDENAQPCGLMPHGPEHDRKLTQGERQWKCWK